MSAFLRLFARNRGAVFGAVVLLVVVLVQMIGRPKAQPRAAQPMTYYEGRWLQWDGQQWTDAESGSPVVGPPQH